MKANLYFLNTTPVQTLRDPKIQLKNFQLIFLMWPCKTKKHIIHNLRQLKKNYIEAILIFLNFYLLLSFLGLPVFFFKPRNTFIKLP